MKQTHASRQHKNGNLNVADKNQPTTTYLNGKKRNISIAVEQQDIGTFYILNQRNIQLIIGKSEQTNIKTLVEQTCPTKSPRENYKFMSQTLSEKTEGMDFRHERKK